MTSTCAHPRNFDDATAPLCRTCKLVHSITRKAQAKQRRINAGGYTRGERIAAA